MTNETRSPNYLEAFIPVVILISLLAFNVYVFEGDATQGPNQIALLFGAVIAAAIEVHENISMKEIKPSPPLKGFFSSLLKNTEEKSSDKHFGIHMCIPRQAVEKEVEYIYDHNIIDHEENEKDYTSFYTYNYHYSPVDKNYFVTYEVTQTEYDDAFNQQFLENRDKIFNTDDRF